MAWNKTGTATPSLWVIRRRQPHTVSDKDLRSLAPLLCNELDAGTPERTSIK
jgi:hypothetical protein